MYRLHTQSVTEKTQADGAFEISKAGCEHLDKHQVFVKVSSTPAAGTLAIQAKTPGAPDYDDAFATVDLTTGPRTVIFDGFLSALKFTPSGFDADKNFSIYIASGVLPSGGRF